jgi:hypothetical protein
MSKSAFTIKAFGIYLLVLGIGLTLIPNLSAVNIRNAASLVPLISLVVFGHTWR